MRKSGGLLSSLFSLIWVVILFSFFVVGCGVKPCKVKNTKEFADKMSYFRDKSGLCYGIVAIKKRTFINLYQEGIGLTCVPCKELEDAGLIDKLE